MIGGVVMVEPIGPLWSRVRHQRPDPGLGSGSPGKAIHYRSRGYTMTVSARSRREHAPGVAGLCGDNRRGGVTARHDDTIGPMLLAV